MTIAERSKSSDLDCGRGDPGSNPGEGRNFSTFFRDGEQGKLPFKTDFMLFYKKPIPEYKIVH